MFNKLVSLLSGGIKFVREQPQFLLTLSLVIIIPIAFLFSAAQFKEAGRANQDRLEKDRIGILHDVFASLVSTTDDIDVIQKEISKLVALNPDITIFRLSKLEGDDIVPVAAYREDIIGIPDNADIYRLAYTQVNESIVIELMRNDVRYIQGVRRIAVLEDDYFVLTETSRAATDALFSQREQRANIILFFVVIVVMLLVLRHVFLVNYSYLYQEAKKAIETKDLFTNMIAHELRAPLTAIRGYASLIHENDSLDETIKEQGKRIELSAERLILIVNDLLDVARIQSGKLSVTKEKLNISKVIVAVIEEQESSAQKKHIALTHEGATAPVFVTGDTKRLHQALTNLVSNAIKYTPEGSIEVSLEDRKDRVEVRIKDTGMGIEAKDQKALFAPFFRVESDDVSAITGTGLGMWITKQLVELMDASIAVESIKGIGTHVVVTLPKNS